jgi:menaquinone-9 beta-reductase
MTHDVIITGGGPAGATCAAFCARSGLKTLLIEKAIFPREKVCGDCINPACWPVLERLGVAGRVLALPHSKLAEVQFIGLRGRSVAFPLHASSRGEIAVKRSHFDNLLLARARECGAEIRVGTAVRAVERGWKVHAGAETFSARIVVAADGRNSTIARLLGFLPAASKERVALQSHVAAPLDFGDRVSLRFLPEGYCGVASVGNGELNVCLVARPPDIAALKTWAEEHFSLARNEQHWRAITPLARRAVRPLHENLLLVGDAARVVEPFTGEGIFYALASGELAARHICGELPLADYARNHARLYRKRLWINRIAKAAVLHPRAGSLALEWMRGHPGALRFLTAKVIGEPLR